MLITSQLVADKKQWQRTKRSRAKPVRSNLKIINILKIPDLCLDEKGERKTTFRLNKNKQNSQRGRSTRRRKGEGGKGKEEGEGLDTERERSRMVEKKIRASCQLDCGGIS